MKTDATSDAEQDWGDVAEVNGTEAVIGDAGGDLS